MNRRLAVTVVLVIEFGLLIGMLTPLDALAASGPPRCASASLVKRYAGISVSRPRIQSFPNGTSCFYPARGYDVALVISLTYLMTASKFAALRETGTDASKPQNEEGLGVSAFSQILSQAGVFQLQVLDKWGFALTIIVATRGPLTVSHAKTIALAKALLGDN